MKTQPITTTCDLCGYGGPYSRADDFSQRGTYDLCKWCMSGPVRETACGSHTVTVKGDSWSCDCGVTMAMLQMTLWRYGVKPGAMDAAPNPAAATASIHVQTPNWPDTY